MMYRAVGMGKYKLCFVLLLPLTVCFDSEVTLVKTIGSEPDLTPLCTNSIEDIITLIVCRIRTERNREECRLLYQYRHDFENNCDSRFRLVMENETVFLHLSSLTPVDSGNYSCECSGPGGTNISHLMLTVEGAEAAVLSILSMLPAVIVSSAAVFISISGIILGLIVSSRRNGCCSGSATSDSPVCEPPVSLDQGDPDDPYTSLQEAAGDVYHTISNSACKPADPEQQKDEEETDLRLSCVYENFESDH